MSIKQNVIEIQFLKYFGHHKMSKSVVFVPELNIPYQREALWEEYDIFRHFISKNCLIVIKLSNKTILVLNKCRKMSSLSLKEKIYISGRL